MSSVAQTLQNLIAHLHQHLQPGLMFQPKIKYKTSQSIFIHNPLKLRLRYISNILFVLLNDYLNPIPPIPPMHSIYHQYWSLDA